MRRLLFVDDEPLVLGAMKNLFRKDRARWDMVFARGGEAALAELAAGPFDLVVSDMGMPGMDGAALLEQVRAKSPATVRVLLTGHAERGALLRALPVAQQILAKPCDAATLRNAIDRACDLRELLANPALRAAVGEPPPVPRLYAELTQALTRPETGAAQIAAVVERDTALSGKLLQLVNSAYFATARPVTTVEQAVSYLGTELVQGLALTAEIFGAPLPPVRGFSVDEVQQRALRTAILARRIAPDQKHGHEAFMAGLLHDVGEVLLAMAAPARLAELVADSEASGPPRIDLERERLGVTHAELGAYLLGAWGLAYPLVEAVAHHHAPRRVEQLSFGLLGAVHVASALVDGRDPDAAYLEPLGMAKELPRWLALAGQEGR